MTRLPLLLAGLLAVGVAAPAQSPGPVPTIDLSVSGQSSGSGEGTATVSGKVNLPPGWSLSVHTLTIRYKKAPGNTTVNGFIPVKGAPFKFQSTLSLPAGSYGVWAVIDVKDPEGRER